MTGGDETNGPGRDGMGVAGGSTAGGETRRISSDEARLAARRDELEKSLRDKRRVDASRDGGDKPNAGFAQAVKLASEFVAGVVVGAGIGWFVDRTFGSAPWGLIVFLLLGFAAGVLNVLRSQGLVAEPGNRVGDGRGPGKPGA